MVALSIAIRVEITNWTAIKQRINFIKVLKKCYYTFIKATLK